MVSSSKSDFSFNLPEALIAKHPHSNRTSSRLMVIRDDRLEHLHFYDILDLIQADDILIINDTKVIKARLTAVKDSGGGASILVERIESGFEALCQVRVSKPLQEGRTLLIGEQEISILGRVGEFYRLRFPIPALEFLDEWGQVPLPPYINRDSVSADQDRYQTVYAQESGAVAAPTAGLHFDLPLLEKLEDKGISRHNITLHVGAGTFQPLRTEKLDDIKLHSERYSIPETTIQAIEEAKGRVIAVGTTVVRTLESWFQNRQREGETTLFIRPGFKFNVVDALITNFHLPESTLLMLVSAFAGKERVMHAYLEAVHQRYRFFSYGDAMMLERE